MKEREKSCDQQDFFIWNHYIQVGMIRKYVNIWYYLLLEISIKINIIQLDELKVVF